MTRRTITTGALAVLALLAPANAAQAKSPTCTAKAGDTIGTERGIRVFTRTTPSKSDPDASKVRLYMCRKGQRKTYTLQKFENNLDGSQFFDELTVGETRFALNTRFETGVTEGAGIDVYDLKGKRVFSGSGEGVPETQAYMTEGGGVVARHEGTITAYDSTGTKTLEATGALALAVSGDTAYWTKSDGITAARYQLAGPAKQTFGVEFPPKS